jgi:DNA-binding GntR family transcriptional regulator
MSQELREKLECANFSDAVFKKLKQAILVGTLKPGERLRQAELSRTYGVSRAPVRDAIRRLAHEGLVTISGQSACVSAVSPEEFLEIYRIREVLEAMAARLSVPRVTNETLLHLERILEEMEKVSKDGEFTKWLELNRKFHFDSYACCNSPLLLKMISNLWDSTDYCRKRYITLTGNLEHANQGHREIFDALAKRDVRQYTKLCRNHVRETGLTIQKVLTDVFES